MRGGGEEGGGAGDNKEVQVAENVTIKSFNKHNNNFLNTT